MANRFANGARAFGFCDVCGFRFDLKKLKNLVVKTKQTQIKACPQCWTPDQPQLQLGMYPVSDPQAIRDPRPDTNTWYQSGTNGLQTDPTSGTGPLQEGFPGEGSRVIEWGWAPIGGSQAFDAPLTPNALVAEGQMGTVTVGTVNGLTSQFFTTPGTTSWTAPASVTRALVICVGGGGSSYEHTGDPAVGVNGVAGTNSSFDSITAGGGDGGLYAGAGGAGGTGTTLSATVFGGNGGAGGTGGFSGAGGGGAGGYAGNGGNGGDASNAVSSPGQNGTGGGGGGGAYYRPAVDRGGGGGGVGLSGIGANGLGGATTSSAAASGGGGSGGATATTSFTSPSGGLYGAGGGGTTFATAGGGGGGGGGLRWSVVAVAPGNSYTVIVGAGGSIPANAGGNGANGAVAVWYVT